MKIVFTLRRGFCKYQSLKQKLQTKIEDQTIKECHQYLQSQFNSSIGKIRNQRYEIQELLYKGLINDKQGEKIVGSLFATRGYLVPIRTSYMIRDYLKEVFGELSGFQKQFVSYYFSMMRDQTFFDMVKSPEEKEQLPLFNYSALIHSKENLIQNQEQIKNWIEQGSFREQIMHLKCYFGHKYQIKQNKKFHPRSKLQQQVELILRNLDIKYLRQQFYQCFKLDFVIGNKILQVHGPSHYVPRSKILKGNQQVKKKIIEKQKKYLVIHHHEWSKLKGLQAQRDFITKLLQ